PGDAPKSDTGVSPVPEARQNETTETGPIPVLEYHARAGRPCHDGASPPCTGDPVLRGAFHIATSLAILLVLAAMLGPRQLRPTFMASSILVSLMAVGARIASRFIWLLISLFNNLALLLFFKYARFV